MTPEDAIKWYESKLAVNERLGLRGPQHEAAKLALEALRARTGEGCKACKSLSRISLRRKENLGVTDVFIAECSDGAAMFFENEKGLPAYISVGFCPVCGRMFPVLRAAT